MKSYDEEKIKQMLLISHLYYEKNMGQVEISKKIGLSRPTISRSLQTAKEMGLVKIQIENPFVDFKELEQQLSDKYKAKISIVPTNYKGETTALNSVGMFAAEYLSRIIKPEDIIGIGWGKTVHAVTKHIEKRNILGVQAVQLKGSVSFENERTYAYESITELAKAFNTQARYLPLPTIFDNVETKKMVEKDRFIKSILDLGRQANIAIFTVGVIGKDALLFHLGYLNDEQKMELESKAVGDIASHFIDEKGEIVSQELDDRTIGIQLEDLKKKEHSIVVASDVEKAAGVNAVLKAGYANTAVIGSSLAQNLIDYK
ncbi:sugar-binding transcriptional regulator [Dellaglioa algida]|uniref:DeoR family transcriptional regulator n=1 Tax=Dellaglioa algida DSM 15638 TaxID=1423719 RepID=A0A0R1HQ16_9LACO|nr:sugar-binding transcriptional regulator [Dellaglioa algida]KRK45242.1 DeoR family transcriptional regulator [Dellaglioa algida DSM 15638]MDK1733338.1 sugar-binding transcriptional regulator [Dellaglioa algida]MDK1734882.1 sugar-binding transcriptional regulator [Dellaglioa algida]